PREHDYLERIGREFEESAVEGYSPVGDSERCQHSIQPGRARLPIKPWPTGSTTMLNWLPSQLRSRDRRLSRVWTALALSIFCRSRNTLRPSCSSRMTLLGSGNLSNWSRTL